MMTEKSGAMLQQGLRLCQAGSFAQAEQIYRQVLAEDADAADAWNMLALVCYEQRRFDEAAEAAQRATQLRPGIPPYWLTRGNIAMARNRDREARADFGRALEIYPAFAEAHYRLALSYHREHRLENAIAAYKEALRYAPDVAEIHYQLADALILEERWVDAMHAYEQAFARDAGGLLDRRGFLDFLSYLEWESLPPFWAEEITRFFARTDIDKSRYANVGLRALKVRRGFHKMLGAAQQADAPFQPETAALREVMEDELFRLLLRDALIPDREFEIFLTRLRGVLLFDGVLRAKAPLDFLLALALQCFNNEFVFGESRDECAQVAELEREVAGGLRSNLVPDALVRSVAVLAMYRPLHSINDADLLLSRRQHLGALEPLLLRSVVNVRRERELRQGIRVIGAITDVVSTSVREMYEEHPYPRWFSSNRWSPMPFQEWIEREVPMLDGHADFPARVRILVAGCGTGQDAIWLANDISNAHVVAVDLSASSLAYAQRMADELAVANIEFRQADILNLSGWPERFDMIYSKGVIHHMRDPQAGLRVLLQLLRPGGLLKLGLYSKRARASINAARELIRQEQLAATETAIRAFRQRVFVSAPDSALHGLLAGNDFYSTSMCRDMIFHVQEHQYRLPQIAAMLNSNGLTLLGLSDVPRSTVAAYRRLFPGDEVATNLRNWDVFEAQHPGAFINLYQFWSRMPQKEATAEV